MTLVKDSKSCWKFVGNFSLVTFLPLRSRFEWSWMRTWIRILIIKYADPNHWPEVMLTLKMG